MLPGLLALVLHVGVLSLLLQSRTDPPDPPFSTPVIQARLVSTRLEVPQPAAVAELEPEAEEPVDMRPSVPALAEARIHKTPPANASSEEIAARRTTQRPIRTAELRRQLLSGLQAPTAGAAGDSDRLARNLGLEEKVSVEAENRLPKLLELPAGLLASSQTITSDGRPVICRQYENGEETCLKLPAVDPGDPFDPDAIFSVQAR